MGEKDVNEWSDQSSIRRVLLAFYSPRTPQMVENITGIKKIKIKPFLEKSLLKSLNPKASKGRLYTVTNKSRRLLKLPTSTIQSNINWAIKGWVIASPRQRAVVLKIIDSAKRTSEEIRQRAIKYNPHLTRISTKSILNELVSKNLVDTELNDRRRYYWINDNGRSIVKDIVMRH